MRSSRLLIVLFRFHDDFHPSCARRLYQYRMIAFALIGVGTGERSDGFVERIAVAEIPTDLRWRPERAWACARVQPQSSAYWVIIVGVNKSTRGVSFMSLSWRT